MAHGPPEVLQAPDWLAADLQNLGNQPELGLGRTHNRITAGYGLTIKCFKYRSNQRLPNKGQGRKNAGILM